MAARFHSSRMIAVDPESKRLASLGPQEFAQKTRPPFSSNRGKRQRQKEKVYARLSNIRRSLRAERPTQNVSWRSVCAAIFSGNMLVSHHPVGYEKGRHSTPPAPLGAQLPGKFEQARKHERLCWTKSPEMVPRPFRPNPAASCQEARGPSARGASSKKPSESRKMCGLISPRSERTFGGEASAVRVFSPPDLYTKASTSCPLALFLPALARAHAGYSLS